MNLLDNGPPADIINADGSSPVVLVCEHASCHIPAVLDHLGLGEGERRAHIAWDIGAEAMARKMSEKLDAALVLQRYSRLVYDCNRPPENPGAWPEKSEDIAIPGNIGLGRQARSARVEQIYRPFHQAVSGLLDKRSGDKGAPVFVTVHSFTPVFHGNPRLVELGILHDEDARLADAMLAQDHSGYIARRNEPYGPEDGVTHTLNLHGGAGGLKNVMLEVRNDLIGDEAGQELWADRLSRLLVSAMA